MVIADDNYAIPTNVVVRMWAKNGSSVVLLAGTDYTYTKESGELEINAGVITGDISVDYYRNGGDGGDDGEDDDDQRELELLYTVTTRTTGMEVAPGSVVHKNQYNGMVIAQNGYELPTNVVVRVGGVKLVADTHYEYFKETGALVIFGVNVTTNITVNYYNNGGDGGDNGGNDGGGEVETVVPAKTGDMGMIVFAAMMILSAGFVVLRKKAVR